MFSKNDFDAVQKTNKNNSKKCFVRKISFEILKCKICSEKYFAQSDTKNVDTWC